MKRFISSICCSPNNLHAMRDSKRLMRPAKVPNSCGFVLHTSHEIHHWVRPNPWTHGPEFWWTQMVQKPNQGRETSGLRKKCLSSNEDKWKGRSSSLPKLVDHVPLKALMANRAIMTSNDSRAINPQDIEGDRLIDLVHYGYFIFKEPKRASLLIFLEEVIVLIIQSGNRVSAWNGQWRFHKSRGVHGYNYKTISGWPVVYFDSNGGGKMSFASCRSRVAMVQRIQRRF